MIALYLLAAHLVGDFVLQTRWQAAGKAGWTTEAVELRARHVLAYCVPFVPLAIIYAPDTRRALGFMAWLYVLHFLTDSRRFASTVGDWVSWTFTGAGETYDVGERHGEAIEGCPRLLPNPWTPIPILIDQTLHVCQIALLGGLLLT